MQTRFSKRGLAIFLSLFFVLCMLVVIFRKYVWLYATRKPDPRPPTVNLLQDPQASKNPEILLAEANRLAWLFNSPKAEPFYVRAQQLFGSGVKLRPGQNIEYIITDSESEVPNDRVRAFALWEGWFGYDRKKYAAMLREAFEPFVLCLPKRAEPVLLSDSISENDLPRFPLFSVLPISRL